MTSVSTYNTNKYMKNKTSMLDVNVPIAPTYNIKDVGKENLTSDIGIKNAEFYKLKDIRIVDESMIFSHEWEGHSYQGTINLSTKDLNLKKDKNKIQLITFLKDNKDLLYQILYDGKHSMYIIENFIYFHLYIDQIKMSLDLKIERCNTL